MSERFKVVSAAHLLVLKDGNILLSKRHNTGYEDGNYSVPAGHHDAGESMSDTAIRELKEEADLTISKENVEFGCVIHRIKPSKDETIDYFFIVKNWHGDIQNCEPDRCSDLSFFPVNNLPSNIIPYVKEGIEASLAKKHFVEVGW